MKICISILVHDDSTFLAQAIRSFRKAGPVFVFVSKTPWHGVAGNWEQSVTVAEAEGATVIEGQWASENEQRCWVLEEMERQGFEWVLIPDGDEIIEEQLLDTLIEIATHDLADRVAVEWDTYWHDCNHVIRPREPFKPLILLHLPKISNAHLRHYEGGRLMLLPATYGIIHHLSYVGPDDRVARKLASWSHREEVVADWFDGVYRAWANNKLMRELHPTHPGSYAFAERVCTPLAITRVSDGEPEATDGPASQVPARWPKISVVIPLYGGPEEIKLCLDSLSEIRGLLHEVFVVDNASPDNAAEVASEFDFVSMIRNDENLGFAVASNQGVEASTGDIVVFLNSDAIVPRAALIPLIDSLCASSTVGAVAPLTNYACTEQAIDPTYTSLEGLNLFALDLADSGQGNEEADFIIGFCLAARRSTLMEVSEQHYKGLGFDPVFPVGGAEDCDLCYRLRRAGYKLMIVHRSYVHHHGSRSFARVPDSQRIIQSNDEKFRSKWQRDIESGYASHLVGQSRSRIIFNENRKPETLDARARVLAADTRISLCMIVRNEERVIHQCLSSAAPFFREVIIVDTGSTDKTREICRSFGAKVIDYPWTDSFSDARNESMKYAACPWIAWIDADDIIPCDTAFAMVDTVRRAPPSLKGVIMPIQFVESDGMGTRVDHVKIFRNLPGLQFEGRIHEQILPSLNQHPGDIMRLDMAILHAGYDTSPEGQAKKLKRDYHLLTLELRDRPDNPFVHFNWGMTERHAGKFEDAIKWFQSCLELGGPELSFSRKAYTLWSQSYAAMGNINAAIETAKRGLREVGPDPELHYQLGRLYSETNAVGLALEHLEKATLVSNGSPYNSVDIGIYGPRPYMLMSEVCAKNNRYAEAKHWAMKALEKNPSWLEAKEVFFGIALSNGDLPCARTLHKEVLSAHGPCEAWATMRAELADCVGGDDLVIETLVSAGRQYPHSLGVRLVLCRQMVRRNRFQEAIPHLEYAASQGVAEAAFYRGRIALDCGKQAEAIRWLEVAHQLNPGHAETMRYMDLAARACA